MSNPQPDSGAFGPVLRSELAAIERRREVISQAQQREKENTPWGHAGFASEPPPAETIEPGVSLEAFRESVDWANWEQAYHAKYSQLARPTADGWRDQLKGDATLPAAAAAYANFQHSPEGKPDVLQRVGRALGGCSARWRPWGRSRVEFAEAFESREGRAPGPVERTRAMWRGTPRTTSGETNAESALRAFLETDLGKAWRDRVAPDAPEPVLAARLREDDDAASAFAALAEVLGFSNPPAGATDPLGQALADAAVARFLQTSLGGLWAKPKLQEFQANARPSEDETRAEFEADQDLQLALARRQAQEAHLAGLAFSGGGIRSATFAVGIMQGLASLKLLRWFDLLSTVSGGGYAGSWLTAWMAREGDPLNVERQLGTSRIDQASADRPPLPRWQAVEEEPEPLRHLREYSSFLNPRPGWFSIDTWTVLAIYLRNLTINALLLIPALIVLAIISRWFAWGYAWLLQASKGINGPSIAVSPRFYSHPIGFLAVLLEGWPVPVVTLLYIVGVLLVMLGFFGNYRGLGRLRDGATAALRPNRAEIQWRVVMPIVLGAICLAGVLPAALNLLREDVELALATKQGGIRVLGFFGWIVVRLQARGWIGGDGAVSDASYLSYTSILAHVAVCTVLIGLMPLWRLGAYVVGHRRGPWDRASEARRGLRAQGRALVAAMMGGATGGVALALAETALRSAHHQPWLQLMIGPPLLLLVVSVAITALVAVLSDAATELEREWWGSLSARFLWIGTAWACLVATLGFGPALLMSAGVGTRAALATGWVGVTALAGRLGYLASLKRAGGKAGGVFLTVAPLLFLAGLLAAVSLLVTFIFNGMPNTDGLSWIQAFSGTLWKSLQPPLESTMAALWLKSYLGVAVLVAFLGIGFSYVKVNLFSLNAFYTNRLARCFLGASRKRSEWVDRWDHRRRTTLAGAPTGVAPPEREADRVTGFDANDDFPLSDLAMGGLVVSPNDPGGPRRYWGPHYLVNTSLSLITGEELAWRDRKAASFVLSPLFSGSTVSGYASSAATGANLSLGRAVAISGAAVDPSMSIYQSSGLTALLTVLNVRLGHWLRNPGFPRPGDDEGWTAEEPGAGLLLFNELAGDTNARGDYIRLTDGGHFENLGVYELLRRRARYIVAVDATENPNATSDNLGILVRLARVDFGIRIQLDTSPLAVTAPDHLSRAHVSIGRIRYDDVDNGQMPGILVYIRASMTGDEPPDVQQYANTHPQFPREGTIDQSFDENQFESYRALGEHIARTVFETAAREVRTSEAADDASSPRERFIRIHRRMFASLRNLWSNPPLDQDERAMQATRAWVTLQRDLRGDPRLGALSRDLYPELDLLPRWTLDRDRAELHALEQMLQTMEDAWLGLGMKGYPDLPMNRGWMNTLRRLAASATFRKFWPVLRTQHSPEFVRFCEEQLRLQADPPRLRPVSVGDPALRFLGAAFAREWPREV